MNRKPLLAGALSISALLMLGSTALLAGPRAGASRSAAPPALAQVPPGTPSPERGGTPASPYPISLAAQLPLEELVAPRRVMRLFGVTPDEAEVLFTTALAAAYFWDSGELVVLVNTPSAATLSTYEPAPTVAVGVGGANTAEDLGTRSVSEFLADISTRFPGLELGAWGRYLIKVPSVVRRTTPTPARAPELSATTQGTVLNEGFESDPWVRWQRGDSQNGKYTWATTTCAAHSGTQSADAIRGGSVGSTLLCTDGYPLNLDSWMDDLQCENIQGASEAWLDLYVFLDCQGSSDSFGVYYPGNDQYVYGYAFSGNVGSWLHYVFNLRQWYKLGDLTTNACNQLTLLFSSDEAGIVGTGVRVDDIRIQTGPFSGFSCTTSGNPLSGPAPLTVNFTATLTGASGAQTYSWSFGDGSTASVQNPSHTFTSAGDYNVNLRIVDGHERCYSQLKVTVTSGGGSGTQPLPGTYVGTTSQGKPISFDVDSSGSLTRWAVDFSCGGTTGNVTTSTFSGCPVSNGTFSCGSDSCPATGTNVKVMGTFGTSSSASGTLNLAVRPMPTSDCCTAQGITWAATLQGGAPQLSASVSATPTSGAAPLAVYFTGSASGGTPPYTYSWNFGDTTTSSQQNPTHTYTAAGTYTATLTVRDAASATATASKTITVTPPVMAYRYFVPAIAHNPGYGTTMWRTNVGVVNRSGSPATLSVVFHSTSGDDTRSTSLAAGSAVEWANVLEGLFGVSSTATASGSLEIGSTVPLSIVARNFNQTDAGTYGQFFPALTDQQALISGQVGVLPLLKKNGDFRTNIGAINLGTSTCTLLIRLFDSTGTQIGTSTTLTLQPKQWQQANDIFVTSGAGYQEVAYATTEIQTSGGRAWLYAAVVDGRTGDPTTVPVAPLTGAAANQWLAQLGAVPVEGGEQRGSDAGAIVLPSQTLPGGMLVPSAETSPGAAANPYTGYWYGKTSQNLPVNVHITSTGLVDYFTLRLRLNLITATCTGTAGPSGPFPLNGSQLSTTVTFPGSNVTSDVSGTFSSSTAASGTYSGYSGSVVVVCGSSLFFVWGSVLSDGTWNAAPETAPPLSVTVSANPTSGTAPLTITFTPTTTGGTPPYSCIWDFGDESFDYYCDATHRYGSGGNFSPKVYVTDGHNWVVTATADLSLVGGAPLTATATASPSSGVVPLTVYFGGSASGGTMPFTYSWDFGDGTPTSSERNPSHSYKTVGTYAATLTVHDGASLTATDSETITVTVPPPLSASVSAYPTSGYAPLTVYLTGSASGGTSPYTYSWDLGDGSATSTEHYPTHIYTAPGTYTATLTVQDAVSATATDSETITVTTRPPLTAAVTAYPTSGVAPLTVSFTGTGSGGTSPYTYSWDFGDGTPTSSEHYPSHTYTAPGTYTATLTVQDSASATATASKTITVSATPPPTASVSATPTSGAAPLTVRFTGSASGGTSPYTYSWDFGDGFPTSSQQSPSHTYTAAGTYTATLTVRDAVSATGTASRTITVTPPPSLTATAAASPTSGAAPLAVYFTGSASGGTPPYTYSWNFGDTTTSSQQNPTHTYTAAGTYTATLTVRDAASATATASKTITVTPPVMAYRYFVPAIAHNPGYGTTMWRTNVGVVNRSGSPATLSVVFHSTSGDDTRSTSLAAGSAVEWANVLEGLFGVSSTATASGSLEIGSTVPLSIVARNFNQTDAGTYGQFFPALTDQQALISGQVGVLPLLKKNGDFRTNIGAINLGTSTCTLLIRLFDSTGTQIGTSTTLTLQPKQWQQANDIFVTSGAGYQEVAYATTEIQTSGGRAWLYAAVVDGRTGDPTTVPMIIQ